MQVSKMHLVSGFAAQQWAMTQQARDDIARLGQEKLAEQEVLLLSAQKVLNAKKRKIRTLTSLLEQVPTQGVETGAVKGEDVRLHDAYPHSKDFLGGKRARSQSPSNHSSTSGSSGGDDSTSSRDRSTSGDKLTDFNGAIHPSPAVDYPFISSETPPPPSSLLVATDEDQKTVQTVEPHRKKRRKSNCEAAPKDSDQNWLEDLFQP